MIPETELTLKISKTAKNKMLKQERKLWLTFVKKVLKLSEELQFSKINSKNLLVDNRDYQVLVGTEGLFILYGDIITDIYVLPCKTWFIITFQNDKCCRTFMKNNELLLKTGINQIVPIDDVLFNKTKAMFAQESCLIIEQFKQLPKGCRLFENIIPETEQQELITSISKLFENCEGTNKICKLRNRQAIHFGHVFDYNQNTICSSSKIEIVDTKFPEISQDLLNKLFSNAILPEMPDQLTINRYSLDNGDHIPPHVDTHSMCTEWILSVSFGSDVVMNFTNPRDSQSKINSVKLKSGSALLLQDESRYLFRHSIQQTSQDLIVFQNKLALSPRGLRFSLTFRKITDFGYKCQCSYPETCDSQQTNNATSTSITDGIKAIQLENEHVHLVYNDIAVHFSSTRYGCWAKVVEFLNSLPSGSFVLDVGCGNGKYMLVNPNIVMLGSDRSGNLLRICRERTFEVFQDDCIQISNTIRSNTFEAAICIAVIHHLSTEQRRLNAILSLVKLLTIGGQALVTVWALEQTKDSVRSKYLKENNHLKEDKQNVQNSKLAVHTNRTEFQDQDVFVPWSKSNNKSSPDSPDVKLRYYHVFREGELEQLISKVDNIEIVKTYYDQGNWCAIFKRLK